MNVLNDEELKSYKIMSEALWVLTNFALEEHLATIMIHEFDIMDLLGKYYLHYFLKE